MKGHHAHCWSRQAAIHQPAAPCARAASATEGTERDASHHDSVIDTQRDAEHQSCTRGDVIDARVPTEEPLAFAHQHGPHIFACVSHSAITNSVRRQKRCDPDKDTIHTRADKRNQLTNPTDQRRQRDSDAMRVIPCRHVSFLASAFDSYALRCAAKLRLKVRARSLVELSLGVLRFEVFAHVLQRGGLQGADGALELGVSGFASLQTFAA